MYFAVCVNTKEASTAAIQPRVELRFVLTVASRGGLRTEKGQDGSDRSREGTGQVWVLCPGWDVPGVLRVCDCMVK
jgi:hypothetical protein